MPAPRAYRWLRWPRPAGGASPEPGQARLGYGGDYNPEQWPREVWADDVRLMRQAEVNIVSLAVFSWSRIQPSEDVWDFAWLDEVMDLLHANGIAVDLATATASPPPWLSTRHPEILPVTRSGKILWPGARQHWRPTSPVFRRHALRLVQAMAARYADHPALTAWHVSNELGCHNAYDYSDDAAAAFRVWLRERYDTIDGLNHAWGTAFWSQAYSAWEQVLPPRLAASHPNPTQQLDFQRFCSDALKEYLCAERDLLAVATPDVPVTSNFMVMGQTKALDYDDWAREVSFVSNDHYVVPGPQALDELSFSANLTSGLAAGQPWFLMEHSTSAVNWQPVNVAKRPGELLRDSLSHVAHGADAVCFFQWRQSRAGAEKYHSGMVPHAGEGSAVYRDVTALGRLLATLAPVAGSRRRRARVAILFDWESWWASELDSHPTSLLRYRAEALDWYSALLDLSVRCDVLPATADFHAYEIVIAPILHVVSGRLAATLGDHVRSGGHLVTTYFSGIVDQNDHIWPGGYPGAFRDLLGIRIEEFFPLRAGESVDLDDDTTGTLWTDRITVTAPDTEVLARYTSGDLSGGPAVTRRATGPGSATYVSTRLGPQGIRTVLERVLSATGVDSELPQQLRGRVELTVRRGAEQDFWFLINRTDEPLRLTAPLGQPLAGSISRDGDALVLAGRGAAVLTRSRPR